MNMKKYPKWKYPNHEDSDGVFADGEIVIEEKLDGASFRFMLQKHLDEKYHDDDRDIVFGSRNIQYKNAKDESNQFEDTMQYIRAIVNSDAIENIEESYGPLTFFGESMENPHTISYDWENTPLFIGFDIWSHDAGSFLTRSTVESIYSDIGLDVVPLITTVTADTWDDYDFECPESEYYDGLAEGVMFKNHATEVYAKFVREDFKEKNKEAFGQKPTEPSGADRLSYSYITNARIEKNAYKMIDEGPWESLQMEMMAPKDDYPGLPQKVIRDMVDEEGYAIFMDESWEVDLGEFRSSVSSRCATVLRRMIDESIRNSM